MLNKVVKYPYLATEKRKRVLGDNCSIMINDYWYSFHCLYVVLFPPTVYSDEHIMCICQ